MIQEDLPIWVHLRSNRLIWRGTLKVQDFKDRKRKDLADWMSTGASRLAKAVSAVLKGDSYCANLPICGGAVRQVQLICHLNRTCYKN
jgi:hypothetical protein